MNKIIFCILFFNLSSFLKAQESIKLVKETKQLADGKFQIIEKSLAGDTLIIGFLSTIDPEVRNGEFIFYNSNRVIAAKGNYTNNIPSGIWYYYDKQYNITKKIDYDKTLEFLKSDTTKIKEEFLIVEEFPSFKNKKYDSFQSYIDANLVYPIYAMRNCISDNILLLFTVTENGKICHITIAKSTGNLDLNMEALRLMSDSPLWIPGKQRDRAVAVRSKYFVRFRLQKPNR